MPHQDNFVKVAKLCPQNVQHQKNSLKKLTVLLPLYLTATRQPDFANFAQVYRFLYVNVLVSLAVVQFLFDFVDQNRAFVTLPPLLSDRIKIYQ